MPASQIAEPLLHVPNAKAPLGASIERVVVPRRIHTEMMTWAELGSSLFVVLLVAKLSLLPFPVSTRGEFGRWLLRLNIVVSPDLSFVTGLTLVCWLTSHGLQRWPRLLAWVWRPACVTLYLFAAIYAAASVTMYEMTMAPFTIRVLSFVGDPSVTISSIMAHLPWPWLVVAPVAVALGPWVARSWPFDFLATHCHAKSLAIALVLVVINGVACQSYISGVWTDPNLWERRIAQSPHWILGRSCAAELTKNHPFTYSYLFDAIDDSDFRRLPFNAAPGAPEAFAPLIPESQRPRNVFLIVLESTPAVFFGVQGSHIPTTPNLDQIAARQGVVFENIYAQSTSSCKNLVALMNSAYPHPNWRPIARDDPAFDVPALPRILREHGYRTCYAAAGHRSSNGYGLFLSQHGVDQLVEATGRPENEITSQDTHNDTTYRGVLKWIDSDPNRPFFAFAYVSQTRVLGAVPQEPNDFNVDSEALRHYLNSIRGIDEKIACLLGELDRRRLLDSTLVAITADHGASFGQHGQWTHAFAVYEQSVHVPFVLLHRSLVSLPRRGAAIGELVDIAPTLLDALGIPAPAQWQGRSLFRADVVPRAYFMCAANELTLGLRDGRYKYHYYVDTRREELFNVEADNQELKNLAETQPWKCEEYRRRVGGWITYQQAFLAVHGVAN